MLLSQVNFRLKYGITEKQRANQETNDWIFRRILQSRDVKMGNMGQISLRTYLDFFQGDHLIIRKTAGSIYDAKLSLSDFFLDVEIWEFGVEAFVARCRHVCCRFNLPVCSLEGSLSFIQGPVLLQVAPKNEGNK